MAWILVQLFFIPFFFLQPLVFVLGLTLGLVAWSRMRERILKWLTISLPSAEPTSSVGFVPSRPGMTRFGVLNC